MASVPKFCTDYTEIENYDIAINSDITYDCHHRFETDMSVTAAELIERGLYYDRPASELIFLTKSEHTRIHNLATQKGSGNWFYGHHHTEETKRRISEANKKERRRLTLTRMILC